MHETNPTPARARKTPDYRIDAPGLVRSFLVGGVTSALVFAMLLRFVPEGTTGGAIIEAIVFIATLYLFGMGALMLVWSKVIKVRQRRRTLDRVSWRGDEQVLDVGCGRGLMLIGAAFRLTTGRAIGIDIWSAADQSSN